MDEKGARVQLTKQERNVIRGLQRYVRTWPDNLWLFVASGTLCVMRKNAEGQRAVTANGGVDPDYVVGTVDIEADGGDW